MVNADLIRHAKEMIRQAEEIPDEEKDASTRTAALLRSAAYSLLSFAELEAMRHGALRSIHEQYVASVAYTVIFDGQEHRLSFSSLAYTQGLARIFDLRTEVLRRVGSQQSDPLGAVRCFKMVDGIKVPFTTDEEMALIGSVTIPNHTVYIDYVEPK